MATKLKWMVIWLTVAATLLLMAYSLLGQTKTKSWTASSGTWSKPTDTPKEYKLTEVQLLRLQVVQKDAMLLKAQMQDLQRQFGEKVGQLQSTAEKIKLENSWPPETQFDMDQLKFSAPKEEKK